MRLSDLCIRRPVFTTMLIASLVVLGLASYRDLGLDAFPRIEFPTVTVTTTLEGVTPEEVESQITKPIEGVVNTISGIDELRSTTKEGISQVFVTFVLEKPVDVAANEVRDKVATILAQFPLRTDPPSSRSWTPTPPPSWLW
jgi:HAE1 family hydrophobic/amphiphilic exporter-1